MKSILLYCLCLYLIIYCMKKFSKKIVWIVGWVLALLIIDYFIYWDQTRCYEIQSRCTPYDLTTVENLDDIDFYRWLNEKCMGKCGTAKLKLNLQKKWCRHQFKQYKESTKDRRYFKADTYNPCPELYTLSELNFWLSGKE